MDVSNQTLIAIYNIFAQKTQLWQGYATNGGGQLSITIATAKVEAYQDAMAVISNLINGNSN